MFKFNPVARNTIITTILIIASILGVLTVVFAFISIFVDDWMSATATRSSTVTSSSTTLEKIDRGISVGLFSFCRQNSNCEYSFETFYNLVVRDRLLLGVGCEAGKFPGDYTTEESKRSNIRALSVAVLILVIFGGLFCLVATFSALAAVGFFNDRIPDVEQQEAQNTRINNNNNTSAVSVPIDENDEKSVVGRHYNNNATNTSSRSKRRNISKNGSKFTKPKYTSDPNLSSFSNRYNSGSGDDDDSDNNENKDNCCKSTCAPIIPFLILPLFIWSMIFFGLALLLWTILETSVLNCSGQFGFCDSVLASTNSIFSSTNSNNSLTSSSSTSFLVTCGFSHSFFMICVCTGFTLLAAVFIFILRRCFGNPNDDDSSEEDDDDEEEMTRKMTEEEFEVREKSRTFAFHEKKAMSTSAKVWNDAEDEDDEEDEQSENNTNRRYFDMTSPKLPPKTSTYRAAQIFLADLFALRNECLHRHSIYLSSLIVSARLFEIERRQRINIKNVEADFRFEFVSSSELREMMAGKNNNNKTQQQKFLPPTRIPNRAAGGFGSERYNAKTKSGGRYATDKSSSQMLVMPDIPNDVKQLSQYFLILQDEEQQLEEEQEAQTRHVAVKNNNTNKPSAISEADRALYGEDDDDDDQSTLTDTTDLERNNHNNSNANNISSLSVPPDHQPKDGNIISNNVEDHLGDATFLSSLHSSPADNNKKPQQQQNHDDSVVSESDPNNSYYSPPISKVNLLQHRKKPLGLSRSNTTNTTNHTNETSPTSQHQQGPPKLPRAFMNQEEHFNVLNEDHKQEERTQQHQHLDRFGRPLPKALVNDYQDPMQKDDEAIDAEEIINNNATSRSRTGAAFSSDDDDHEAAQRREDISRTASVASTDNNNNFDNNNKNLKKGSISTSVMADLNIAFPPPAALVGRDDHVVAPEELKSRNYPGNYNSTSNSSSQNLLAYKTKALRDRLALLSSRSTSISHHQNQHPQQHQDPNHQQHDDDDSLLNISNITATATAAPPAPPPNPNQNQTGNNNSRSGTPVVHSFQDYWQNRSKRITNNTSGAAAVATTRQDSEKLTSLVKSEEQRTPSTPTTKMKVEKSGPRYN